MLYALLKIPARLVLKIYCRIILVNKPIHFKDNGPLLIAANHPNSFLDAIILSTLFNKPIVSLARGDVFVSGFINRTLMKMNMLPVYRISEGSEKLEGNYDTFSRCREIFKKNGIVLIFSEGLCINEWHLRNLKKGTARLALQSWDEGLPLAILPLGINYQSFTSFGKNIILNFGDIITRKNIDTRENFGNTIRQFNEKLKSELSKLVIEADGHDDEKLKKIFYRKSPPLKKILLLLPAILGFILHIPLFSPIEYYIRKKAAQSGHYDSILIVSLFLLYPFYIIALVMLAFTLTQSYWSLLLIIALPWLARCYIQLKSQF